MNKLNSNFFPETVLNFIIHYFRKYFIFNCIAVEILSIAYFEEKKKIADKVILKKQNAI